METEAAILWGTGQDWKVETIELDPPKAGEVLVRIAASGMCHSDEHLRTGDLGGLYPIIGGHEGAGVVEEVDAELVGILAHTGGELVHDQLGGGFTRRGHAVRRRWILDLLQAAGL